MKVKYLSISLLLTSIFLNSCDVNDSTDNDYSQSVTENEVTLLVKNGTVSSDGEFKIINKSNKKIFIPFIQYPVCNFSFYSIQKKNNSIWESLSYMEGENKWIKKEGQDTILAVCDRYVPPLELEPNESVIRNISGFSEKGEFRLIINFSYSSSIEPNTVYYSLTIKYLVE